MATEEIDQINEMSGDKQNKKWPPIPPDYEHDALPPRYALMERAYELGIEHYGEMSDKELVAAIKRQEDALARSLL